GGEIDPAEVVLHHEQARTGPLENVRQLARPVPRIDCHDRSPQASGAEKQRQPLDPVDQPQRYAIITPDALTGQPGGALPRQHVELDKADAPFARNERHVLWSCREMTLDQAGDHGTRRHCRGPGPELSCAAEASAIPGNAGRAAGTFLRYPRSREILRAAP